MDRFSTREGIVTSVTLRLNEISDDLRNRLWNFIHNKINYKLKNYNEVIEKIWGDFFKRNIRELNRYQSTGVYRIDQIENGFLCDLQWYQVYDFIEFILALNLKDSNMSSKLNSILADEGSPYLIIDNKVIPITSEIEVEEVTTAIYSKYQNASIHIKKSLSLFQQRPNPDYLNSIKESISAIEAIAIIILNQPDSLGKLIDQLNIHPAFKKGLHGLYGWTSDEGGIRHATKTIGHNDLITGFEEARFMLVQCSALLNYEGVQEARRPLASPGPGVLPTYRR